MDVVSESRINEGDHTVEDVILEGRANYFVMLEFLIVVPLDELASPSGVIYYMRAVELVEASGCHGVWFIFYSRQVHEVYSFMGEVVIEPDFVQNPLQGSGVSQYSGIVVNRYTISYL